MVELFLHSLSSSIARPRSTRKLYMDVKDVAGCPNHYHPSRSDYTVVLDACFWRWVAVPSASGKCSRSSGYRCLNNVLPKNLGCKYDLILPATQYWELMKSVGNHGSSSMLSMMKGMVWHYVSDAHKVKTALILFRLVFFFWIQLD